MTKKDLVALADALRIHNRTAHGPTEFTPDHLRVLADFCASQYPNFNRRRWIDYIAGEGGQGDEWVFVEADTTVFPGASVEDEPVPRVNREEGVQEAGRSGPRLTAGRKQQKALL
jgi:hypothetical protein